MSDDEIYNSDDDGVYNEEDVLYGADCIDDESSPTSKYWLPRCPQHMKPSELMEFEDLASAEMFYREYAKKVGFDVRKNTSRKFNRSDVLIN